jgi:hypothetical protein
LDGAQERHEQEVRSYASVVQHGIQAGVEEASDFEYRPAWDEESDISGLADDDNMSDEGGGEKSKERPRRAGRFQPEVRNARRTATAEHQQSGQSGAQTLQAEAAGSQAQGGQAPQQRLHWPANLVPENEIFRLFKASLSDDQRAFLEGSWAAAAAAATAAAPTTEPAPTAGAATAAVQAQERKPAETEPGGPEAHEGIRAAAALLQALTGDKHDAA